MSGIFPMPRGVDPDDTVEFTPGFKLLMGRQAYVSMCIRAGVAPPAHMMEAARRNQNRAERRRAAAQRRAS